VLLLLRVAVGCRFDARRDLKDLHDPGSNKRQVVDHIHVVPKVNSAGSMTSSSNSSSTGAATDCPVRCLPCMGSPARPEPEP
jgi:hypothetical protein